MPTVLVTRPSASSELFATKLRPFGFDSVIEPLLQIEALGTPRPDATSIEAVMITSANALVALASNDFEVVDLLEKPCFCVGAETAYKAKAFGFRDVENATGDGRQLAQLVAKVLKNPGPVLHISAQEPDSKAQSELTDLGYVVRLWPVYMAKATPKLTDATIQLLQQLKVDCVVVFSVRTAKILVELLVKEGLLACCQSLSAIGLSEAVIDALRPLPWARLAAAPLPTEDAVIECLKRLYPVP